VNIDKAVRKADVKPTIRLDTGARVLHMPSVIGEQGFDAAAGIDMKAEKPESKPLVIFWSKEENVGIFMTEEEETRRRSVASSSASEDQART